MDDRKSRSAEATLGAFEPETREILAPLLLYKGAFLGGWFQAAVEQENDPLVKEALRGIMQESLVEMIGTIAAMSRWEGRRLDPTRDRSLGQALGRHALSHLIEIKNANAEAVVMAAMQAPTDELRRELMRLADLDRRHALTLHRLLGENRVKKRLDDLPGSEDRILGAHEGRGDAGTLSKAIESRLRAMAGRGVPPTRIVVSPVALRHLRDEGAVESAGTLFGLGVDVDFGWEGECFAVVSGERLTLASLIAEAERSREE